MSWEVVECPFSQRSDAKAKSGKELGLRSHGWKEGLFLTLKFGLEILPVVFYRMVVEINVYSKKKRCAT